MHFCRILNDWRASCHCECHISMCNFLSWWNINKCRYVKRFERLTVSNKNTNSIDMDCTIPNRTDKRFNESTSYALPSRLISALKSEVMDSVFCEYINCIFVAGKNVGNLKHSTIIFLVGVFFLLFFWNDFKLMCISREIYYFALEHKTLHAK